MKKILGIINIILPIILFITLQFFDMSSSFVTIMTLTLLVGWILPFIFPIITGICLLLEIHPKKSLVINITTIFLNIIILFLIINLYDSHLLLIMIFYIALSILNIINSIYLILYLIKINYNKRKELKEEYKRIKKIKKENNGIIK